MGKPILAKTSPQVTLKPVQRIAVRCTYDSKMRYSGRASGERYIWNGAGDTVLVLPEDVPYLLDLRLGGRGCCGAVNTEGNKPFELA